MTAIVHTPGSELSDYSDPRIVRVMAAMLMVQEERKTEGDEFRQEPEPEEVEDVCEVPLDQNTTRCGGAMSLQVRNVGLSSAPPDRRWMRQSSQLSPAS